jgi:hypothetical protein
MKPRALLIVVGELAVCSLICNGQSVRPGLAESLRETNPAMSAFGYVSSANSELTREDRDARGASRRPTIASRADVPTRPQIEHRLLDSEGAYAGPSDSTDPKRPLICNPAIRTAIDKAWSSSVQAAHRPPISVNDKVEFGFAVDASKDGRTVEVKSLQTSNFTDKKLNELHIAIDENTLATVHTHNTGASPIPSKADMEGPIPAFVKSQFFVYLTIPGENRFVQIEPDGVCRTREEATTVTF